MKAAEKGYKQSLLDKAALDPHTSTICAIGLNKAQDQGRCTSYLRSPRRRKFWRCSGITTGHHTILGAIGAGANNKECFDPRHIIVRSWKLGVLVPHAVVNTRGYLTDQFVDLSQIYMFGDSYPSYCSSENACKQLGLFGTRPRMRSYFEQRRI